MCATAGSHDRYAGPPPPVMHHPREFRPMHHEYMPRPMHHAPPHMHPPPHHHYVPRHIIPRHPGNRTFSINTYFGLLVQ